MNSRIEKLVEYVKSGALYPETTATTYDKKDYLLSAAESSAKLTVAYIMNQKPVVTDCSAITGDIRFDGTVYGDAFTLTGHKNAAILGREFYNKPFDNLVTYEWQHSCGDFGFVIRNGISGVVGRIEKSMASHTEKSELEFLRGLLIICGGILGWADKCSRAAADKAKEVENPENRAKLVQLSEALKRVPRNGAGSFYEAVLCLGFCFAFIPDSIGTADRYLYPYYVKDMASGAITRDEAKEYIQELYIRLQAHTSPKSRCFTRGGESHFCVGGRGADGEDSFNELSRLMVESLIELPLWIPQMSLRWTEKTPREVLKFMMDCERKDPNKRIAFMNDEPRIRSLCGISGMTYAQAASYTAVGCNEIAIPGGRNIGSSQQNIARSIEKTLYNDRAELLACEDFEGVYALFERELRADLAEILYYEDSFNEIRSRDENMLSSIFFDGCIENARSVTRGGCNIAVHALDVMGLINVIDSLAIIKQFVFDENRATLPELLAAIDANWEGYADLRTMIMKRGRFFGNNDSLSDGMARRVTASIYDYLKDKRDLFGYSYLVGDLIGYNQHNKWFGEKMRATPDGRYAGDELTFGAGQTNGKDMNGLTALLNSVAGYDENGIMRGSTVTNITLDEKLVKDDANFEKLVTLFESYFRAGGVHFQLTYVSKAELIAARENPEKYRNLRVRVSGFSDYFVILNSDLQDGIIHRTEIKELR